MNTRPSRLGSALATVALWLLAAHLFRADMLALAVVAALAPLLLLVPSRAARLAVQLMLVLGAVEWLRTLAHLAAARMSMQQPWLRMTLILLAVALMTGAAAWLLRVRRRA
jgi:hypothetical protein